MTKYLYKCKNLNQQKNKPVILSKKDQQEIHIVSHKPIVFCITGTILLGFNFARKSVMALQGFLW